MPKKTRITVAPKKANLSAINVSLKEQVKQAEKEEKQKSARLYKPKVRLTAHINKK